ncbi:MAG: cysteine dioxygenase family protein [Planctomycetota bacterium]|nr:cysteine dioxygenase family protein [Planctomycetota bacterium]
MKNPPSTIKRLISALSEMETGRFNPQGVADLLSQANISSTDIGPFIHFRADRYTRNLVYSSQTFEVIVLCWPPGSSSPVHDHCQQLGWVRVLEGSLEEVRYSSAGQPEGLDETKKWSPEVHSRVILEASKAVSAVDSQYGIHSLTALDEPTISLHFYSKPHDSCLVFGGKGGQIDRKDLSYDTTPDSRTKQLS